MKSLKKLSLFILLMLFSINVVKADDSCDALFELRGDSYWHDPSYINGVNLAVFSFKNTKTNADYTGYCMNPGWSSGKIKGANTQYSCRRIVMDSSSTSITQIKFDVGLATILTSNNTESDINIAARVYEMYWRPFNKNSQNTSGDYASHKKIANDWFKDADVKAALDTLRNQKDIPKGYIIENEFSGAAKSVSVSGQLNLNKAKSLLIEGLKAAANYDAKNETKLNWSSRPKTNRTLVSEGANGLKNYKQTETYTFDVQNFAADSGSITLSFSCPTCAQKNVSYKLFVNSKEYTADSLKNTNLLKLDQETNTLTTKDNVVNGKFEFSIEFTGSMKDCEEIPYEVNIAYSDVNIVTKDIYEVKATNCGNKNGCQTHIVVPKNANNPVNRTSTATISSKLSFCVAGGTTNENCTTDIEKVGCVQCNENENVINIKEGYIDTDPNSCDSKKELNIKECIAHDGAKDKVGNSYASAELSDTPYCQLYCKEDYKMSLPGSRIVNSGRYFTLTALLEGTKTCYSNSSNGGPIGDRNGDGNSDFWNDIVSAAHSSVDAYNAYALAHAKNNATSSPIYDKTPCQAAVPAHDEYCSAGEAGCSCHTSTVKVTPSQCGSGCTCEYLPTGAECWKNVTTCTRHVDKVDEIKRINGVHIEGEYTKFSYNGSSSQETVSEDIMASESMCEGDGSYAAFLGEVFDRLEKEEGEFGRTYEVQADKVYIPGYFGGSGAAGRVGLGAIYGLTYNLNMCSNANTVDYNGQVFQFDWPGYVIDPELDYWYEDMTGYNTNKLELSSINTNSEKYEMLYCTGSVSADYETCSNGWKTSLSQVMVSGSVFACSGGTPESCKFVPVEYSNATYVKKVMKSEATFISPTLYYNTYPYGNVVSSKYDEYENGSPLENGLPVDLGAQAGARKYILLFKNLGEHYDTGKLGRIWGDNESVVSETLKEENECRADSALKYDENVDGEVFTNGVYSCEYDVNICDSTDKCRKPDESTDGKYHCKDGKECTEEDYNKECSNSCQKPDESTDGKYHCKDGEVCEQDEYLNECDPCPECPVECDPDGCYKRDPECPDGLCPVYCPTCIYNNGSNIEYRPVSPDNLNPNNRDLGANWNFDDNITSALELKAYKTTTEIESDGAKIYDDNSERMKITFKVNGAMIREIKKYNEENKKEGYYNNSLECYDYKDSDGVVYKNIYCYSTFIDQIIEKFPDRVTGLDKRVMGSDRKEKTQTSGYWTTWAEMRDEALTWNVTTTSGIDTYFKDFKNLGVGPSWK